MKLARNRNVNFIRGRAIALPCRVRGCGKVAGNKGAFLNAGKNGGAFHRPGNDLAANLGRMPAGELKSNIIVMLEC